MPITLIDVARELNLSHTTVSRALNNPESSRISKDTRELVIATAKRMGYRPNRAARAMVTGKTYNIGLYVREESERTGQHFARMIGPVDRKASELGYRVVICSQLESVTDEHLVDGIIMLTMPDTSGNAIADPLPCLYVCGWAISTALPNSVTWNDVDGMYCMTSHLLDLGHGRIIGLFGDVPVEYRLSQPKAVGFRKAMLDAGLQPLEVWGHADSDQFRNAYLLTHQAMSHFKDVTGVIARNDIMALGAMKAIKELGKRVPRDVSVAGYNDTGYAEYADPPLTSVRTPIAEAGEIAVAALVGMLENDERTTEGRVLDTTVVVRESSSPPPAVKTEWA